jgi:hypothetical protein
MTMKDANGGCPAQAVTQRALCLAAVCYRANIEAVAAHGAKVGSQPGPELKELGERINGWLISEQLRDTLSSAERRLLDARLGEAGPQEVINATWRAEALTVLLWALELVDAIPPYDTQCELKSALERVGFLKNTDAIVADAKLRHRVELLDARETAETWNWRARKCQLAREPDQYPPPAGKSYEEIVRAAATRAQDAGRIIAIDGDFPAFGKPYRRATEDESWLLHSIAQERHYALNWITGTDEDWDDVLIDT